MRYFCCYHIGCAILGIIRKSSCVTKMVVNILLLLAVVSCTFSPAEGQITPKSKKYFAVTEDLPFIRCSVCRRALKHIAQQVKELRSEVPSKGKKVDEDDILNIVEASCDPDKKQGDWILNYDISEASNGLKIVEQESQGRCQQECKTIAKACEDSIGDIDTDLGELLWKDDLSLSQLVNKICYEKTDVCTKKALDFKKGQRKDEVFKAMSDDEKKAYDVMKQMKSASGMPGMEMYSRDDIDQIKNEFKSNAEDSEVGDEEEKASQKVPLLDSTNLGFAETVKAMFRSAYRKLRNLFSFTHDKSEL